MEVLLARYPLHDGWVDLDRAVVVRDGEEHRLTDRETQLLACLAASPGEVVDRERLHREVWGHAARVVSRAVDFTVHRLRRKLEADPSEPLHLVTERGQGFRFDPVGARIEAPTGDVSLLAVAHDGRALDASISEALAPGVYVAQTDAEHIVLAVADAEHAARVVETLRGWGHDVGVARGRPTWLEDLATGRVVYTGDLLAEAMRATGRSRHSGLPMPRGPLRGRDDALAWLRATLEPGAVVSIEGPPGVGKSTLVGALIHTGVPGMAHVVSVPLAATRDRDGMIARLGLALDLPEPDLPAIRQALTGRSRVLVVLDNTEHLPVDELLAELRDTPTAWLCTTRVPLRTPGATHFPVAPLSVEDGVLLLRDRLAELAAPVPPAAASRALVQALDGLPLALELAASRGRVLTVPQMLDRLTERFRLLSSRVAEPRWSSLRHALAWSWELLTPEQRDALHQLTAFRGGFSLEAAETVLDLPPDGPWVVDLLQDLVELGLLHRQGSTTALPRYAPYQSVHEFVSEEAGPAPPQARHRHLAWFAALAAQPFSRQELDERANLEAALDHALDHDVEGAAQVARVSWRGFRRSGPLASGLAVLQRAQALPGASPEARLGLLLDEGWAHFELGDTQAATQCFEQARDLASAHGLPSATVDHALGVAAHSTSAHDEAEAHLTRGLQIAGSARSEAQLRMALAALWGDQLRLDEAAAQAADAVRLARGSGARDLLATVLRRLGILHVLTGRVDEARACLEESHQVFVDDGDRAGAASTLNNLAGLYAHVGATEQAEQGYREALTVYRELGDRRGQAMALGNLAGIAQRTEPGAAHALYAQALTGLQEVGDRRGISLLHGNLGNLHLRLGDTAAAEEHYRAALAIQVAIGDRAEEAKSRARLAVVAEERDDLEGAAAGFRAALEVHRELGDLCAEAVALINLSGVSLRQSDHLAARASLEAALAAARKAGARDVEGACAARLGLLHLREGSPIEAQPWLDRGEAVLRAVEDHHELCALLCTRVEVAMALGDAATARAAFAEVRALFDTLGVTGGELGRRVDEASAALRNAG